jgi:hypothetical protein
MCQFRFVERTKGSDVTCHRLIGAASLFWVLASAIHADTFLITGAETTTNGDNTVDGLDTIDVSARGSISTRNANQDGFPAFVFGTRPFIKADTLKLAPPQT